MKKSISIVLVFSLLMSVMFSSLCTFNTLAVESNNSYKYSLGLNGIKSSAENDKISSKNYADYGNYDFIYLGNYYNDDDVNKMPVRWRVLDTKGSDSNNNNLFLLSEYILDLGTYSSSNINTWNGSTIQSKCKTFLEESFNDSEKAIIDITKKNDSEGTWLVDIAKYNVWGKQSINDKVFILSMEEIAKTMSNWYSNDNATIEDNKYNKILRAASTKYTKSRSLYKDSKYQTLEGDYTTYGWWTRTPNADYKECVGNINNNGSIGNTYQVVSFPVGFRPAMNIIKDNVLYKLEINNVDTDETLENNLGEFIGNTVSEKEKGRNYKLALIDNDRKFNVTFENDKIESSNKTFVVNYTNSVCGDNEYVSAIIVNENDEIVYYGNISKPEGDSGEAVIKLPENLGNGNYIIKLFNEQINCGFNANICSKSLDFALSINDENCILDEKIPEKSESSEESIVSDTPSVIDTSKIRISGNYKYKLLEDGTAKIIDYTGKDNKVVIPEKLDEYMVTIIGENSFEESNPTFSISGSTITIDGKSYSTNEELEELFHPTKEVILPEGIVKIEKNAFKNCKKLNSITIPKSMKIIDDNAFDNCLNLKNIIYKSTQSDWNSIQIGSGNNYLSTASKEYEKEIISSAIISSAIISSITSSVLSSTWSSTTTSSEGSIISYESTDLSQNRSSVDVEVKPQARNATYFSEGFAYTLNQGQYVKKALPKLKLTKKAKVKVLGKRKLKVTVKKIYGAKKYRVFYKIKGTKKWKKTSWSSKLKFTLKKLKKGKKYIVYFIAKNGKGVTNNSKSVISKKIK